MTNEAPSNAASRQRSPIARTCSPQNCARNNRQPISRLGVELTFAHAMSALLAPHTLPRVTLFRPTAPRNFGAKPRSRSLTCMASADKVVWVSTSNKDVVTAALESGFTTLLVQPASEKETEHNKDPGAAARQLVAWRQLGRFSAVTANEEGSLIDEGGKPVGVLRRLATPDDVKAAERDAGREGFVVVDALDWQIIPAENLVAAFQSPGASARLLAVAGSCVGGRVMLEALEAGTHGVVLRTDDPKEVRQLASYLAQRRAQQAQRLQYTPATVTRVAPVGMGDRACVDLASLLVPGEGLAVGSFARGLFLVHSECGESAYINSRPFRVNAGPVHSYVRMPCGKTAYLSELKSGVEVSVCDAGGHEGTAIVGRVKIEARPLVLVEAVTPQGDTLSVLLQNAETVKLIGPAPAAAPAQGQHRSGAAGVPAPEQREGDAAGARTGESGATAAYVGPEALLPTKGSWRAVSVSSLKEGDEVFVLLQHGARHTGISIEEKVREV